jgi:hypothetical protein
MLFKIYLWNLQEEYIIEIFYSNNYFFLFENVDPPPRTWIALQKIKLCGLGFLLCGLFKFMTCCVPFWNLYKMYSTRMWRRHAWIVCGVLQASKSQIHQGPLKMNTSTPQKWNNFKLIIKVPLWISLSFNELGFWSLCM